VRCRYLIVVPRPLSQQEKNSFGDVQGT
jgi:hypothetical protein